MTAHGDCPSRDLLAALLRGTLSSDQEDAINNHVETCPECESQVRDIEQETDPLIDALRLPATSATRGHVTSPATDSPLDPEPFHLDGYRIVREIGRGGMGVVFQAYQRRLGRPVAIKMILSGRLAGPEERARFMMEGGLLARLNHPNFVQVYEVGMVDVAGGAQPHLVLEYVNGGSLRSELEGNTVPPREAARQVLVLTRAIDTAHAQGIIHRDLKPANVLRAGDGTLKITDFGLAKELGANDGLTPTGLTVGTPEYMAPEQARGDKYVGPATDIYALGAILYEMLSGRPPFRGATSVEVVLKVLSEAPTPPSRERPNIPRDLETICLKCLEKDPPARYVRASDLADDLQCWLDGRPIQARPAGRAERAWKWTRRHPLPATLLALLVLSLVVGSFASTYFGIVATRRASDAQVALTKEADARRAADRRAAELELANGQAMAASGEVDRGLFFMLRALETVPEDDENLRRVVRLNLEQWLPYLPRLRWFNDGHPGYQQVFLGAKVIRRRDKQVFVDDAVTGRSAAPPREYGGQEVWSVDPTGRYACTRTMEENVPNLHVFDRATGVSVGPVIADRTGGELLRDPADHVYSVWFSPDGAAVGRDYHTGHSSSRHLWDVATGKEIGPEMLRPRTAAHYLLRGQDGRRYWLFIHASGEVEVVDAQTGQARGGNPETLPVDTDRPAALFPARTVVQTMSSQGGGSLVLWDAARGPKTQPIWRLSKNMLVRAIAPDGRHLVGISADQRVCWEDIAGQIPCRPTAGAAREGSSLADQVIPGPDGWSCLYASRVRSTLKLFDFPRVWPARGAGAASTERYLSPTAPRALAFGRANLSPDGRFVLFGHAGLGDGRAYARLASTINGQPVGTPLTDCDAHGVFSPSGRMVALTAWDDPNPGADGEKLFARAYDTRTGQPCGPKAVPNKYIHALEFSSDERLLAVGHVAGVDLCDLSADGKTARLVQPGPITQMLFSRDCRRLALCSRAGWARTIPGVRVWDVPTRKPAGELIPMNDAPIILPTEDGDGFLTVERDTGRARRWDFATAAPVEDRGPLADWPTAPRDRELWIIDANRRWLALGSSHGTIVRLDLRSGRRLGPDAEFGQPIQAMAFDPAGRWLAVAGDDGDVGLFDPFTGKHAGPLLTAGVPVRGMAFSPDGMKLITAVADGRCIPWDLGGPQPLGPVEWRTWLEAATGMRLDGDLLIPLTHVEYQIQLGAAQALPTPLTLPREPRWQWHAEEAASAFLAGQLNSARWHLDRWVALEPSAWLPLARRAELAALENDISGMRADIEQARRLCPDNGVDVWLRHLAVVSRLTGQNMQALDAP
jgi:WD40 repeat protein